MAISTSSVSLVATTACTTTSASSAAWDTFVSAVAPETWATVCTRLSSDVSLDAATCVSTSVWKLLWNALVALVELSAVSDAVVAWVITASCCSRAALMTASGAVRRATRSLLVTLVPLPFVARVDKSFGSSFIARPVMTPSVVVVSTVVVIVELELYLKSVVLS